MKVVSAAAVVGRPPLCPEGPIVSTIEKPHGDQAPVSPMRSAAMPRTISSPLIPRAPGRSARNVRVVVHDAEDPPALVAVARQRGVAVDAGLAVGAAVHQLPDSTPAAPIPGAVDRRV